jgi:hypothetical protein
MDWVPGECMLTAKSQPQLDSDTGLVSPRPRSPSWQIRASFPLPSSIRTNLQPPSLQQNVGVVAACAPALKPLVGRWLKLGGTSQDPYASGHRGESSRRTRGTTGTKSGLGQGSPYDQGEGGFEMGPTARHGFHTTVRGGTSPTSSEERIIEWDDEAGMNNGAKKPAVA